MPDEMPQEEAPAETPATVIQAAAPPAQELTQPVIDHAAKIATIEERQTRQEEELIRQIGELEQRIITAHAADNSQLEERLSARLAALEEKLSEAAKATEEAPEEAAELAGEAVEVPAAAEEKKARGLRRRRKAKKNR